MNRKNPFFIIITGFIIAIGRICLAKINEPDKNTILIVMAIVNYVAFGFVVLFLSLDIDKYCFEKIDKSGIETKLKNDRKKKRKTISSRLRWVFLLIYLVVGGFYVYSIKTETSNDVLSIIALSVSIASNGLVDEFGSQYYNFIIKPSKNKGKEN